MENGRPLNRMKFQILPVPKISPGSLCSLPAYSQSIKTLVQTYRIKGKFLRDWLKTRLIRLISVSNSKYCKWHYLAVNLWAPWKSHSWNFWLHFSMKVIWPTKLILFPLKLMPLSMVWFQIPKLWYLTSSYKSSWRTSCQSTTSLTCWSRISKVSCPRLSRATSRRNC